MAGFEDMELGGEPRPINAVDPLEIDSQREYEHAVGMELLIDLLQSKSAQAEASGAASQRGPIPRNPGGMAAMAQKLAVDARDPNVAPTRRLGAARKLLGAKRSRVKNPSVPGMPRLKQLVDERMGGGGGAPMQQQMPQQMAQQAPMQQQQPMQQAQQRQAPRQNPMQQARRPEIYKPLEGQQQQQAPQRLAQAVPNNMMGGGGGNSI